MKARGKSLLGIRVGDEPYRDKTDDLVSSIIAAVLAASLTALTFGGGLNNKPVAEDFGDPRTYLQLTTSGIVPFRPLFSVFLVAIEFVFGQHTDNPFVFHLADMIIHIAVAFCVFLLVRRLMGSSFWALIASAIFTVYPRNHEPVLWPTGASHALMTLWIIVAVLCYAKYTERRSLSLYIFSVMSATVAIFTCESGFVCIGIILLFEILYRDIPNSVSKFNRAVRRIAPFFVPIVAYAAVIVIGTSSWSRFYGSRSDATSYHLSLSQVTISDAFAYTAYALVPFVELRSATILPRIIALGGAVILCGLAALTRTRDTLFGLGWLLLALIPYVLLVPFGNADRYFYLASVGFAVVVTSIIRVQIQRLGSDSSRWRRGMAAGAALTSLTFYLILGVISGRERSSEWREAGIRAETALAMMYAARETIPPGSTIFLVGFPSSYRQARFLGVGIEHAIYEHYTGEKGLGWDRPDVLNVVRVDDPAVVGLVAGIPDVSPFSQVQTRAVVFTYDEGQVRDRTEVIDVPQVWSALSRFDVR